MDAQAFAEFRAEIIRLHRSGEHNRALALATHEGDRFPEWGGRVAFWRACLATRLGDIALAVAVLDEALARGYWFPQHFLREDEDLRPLQGLPAFASIMANSRERQAVMEAEAKPDLLIREPTHEASRATSFLLALHGSNQNARDAAAVWRPALSLGLLLALPESGQPSSDARDTRRRVWTDREQAVLEVQMHWGTVSQRYALDPERSVIGGFSAGGHLALWLILAAMIPVRRFFVVAPSLPPGMLAELIALAEQGAARATRGFIVVGEQDRWSHAGSHTLAASLRGGGAACEVETHPALGHDFPPTFASSLKRGLTFLQGDSASDGR
ncbi:MAG: hypothetical protein M3R06_00950 [Chloroflexota bacterium]|nr:hypothetical protein [Chloroflexota bacterium]